MPDQISLFSLPVLTWDITDSWEFTDPHGVLQEDQEKIVREWTRECPHPESECYDEATQSARPDCHNAIGWTLLNETLARTRAAQLDSSDESD